MARGAHQPEPFEQGGWTKSSVKPGTPSRSADILESGSPEIWIQKVTLASGEDLPTVAGLGNTAAARKIFSRYFGGLQVANGPIPEQWRQRTEPR